MYRMVDALHAFCQQLHMPPGALRTGTQRVDQFCGRQMHRAGTGDEQAIGIQQFHRDFIDAPIGRSAFG